MHIETGSNDYTGYNSTNSKQSDVKKLLLGALAGAAVGTLVAALYTEKGIETRSRVSRKSRKMASDIKEKAAGVAEGIKEKVSNVTTPIATKYESTKKVATKLFSKEKPKSDISHLQGNFSGLSHEDVEISKTKVILSLLAASLAGTAIWSLTTEKGKETRKRAAQSTKEIASKVKVTSAKLVEELKKAYQEAREGMEDLLEQQRQKGLYASPDNNTYNGSTNR